MIVSTIILFALYVVLVAAGKMWRFAVAWGGLPFAHRVLLALSASWKWWLLFCVALLFFDAGAHAGRGIPGAIVVTAIAIVMAVIFAILRPVGPTQKK
jgi:hypothetical protein